MNKIMTRGCFCKRLYDNLLPRIDKVFSRGQGKNSIRTGGHLVLFFLALTLLCGCASLIPTGDGNRKLSFSTVKKRLKLGETRQDEILAWLGEPQRRSQKRGLTIWTYQRDRQETRSTYNASSLGREQAVFNQGHDYGFTHVVSLPTVFTLVFDANGILRNFQLLEP